MNYIFIIIVLLLIFWISNDLLKLFEHYYTGTCITKDGEFGTFYNNECIPFSSSKAVSSTKEVSDSEVSDSGTSNDEEDTKSESQSGSDGDSSGTNFSDENVCWPDNSNFGEICLNRHNSVNFGTKSFDKTGCNEGNTKVKCGEFYFNQVNYNNGNVSSTPCMDKSLDFDELCRYYQPNTPNLRTKGYNVNSTGVKEILRGNNGDCYRDDGSSDFSKAKGICNLKSIERVNKISNFPYNYDYNEFTECKPINHNFENDCSVKLDKSDVNSVYSYVSGFDCNPGFGRAMCIDKSKKIKIPPQEKKFIKDSNSDYLNSLFESS